MPTKWIRMFATPKLSRKRVWFAFLVAALTDATQLALGPLGFVVVDQVLDVVAMILVSSAIGFHALLLPTFILELVPMADMLPTWIGCTAAVVMLRNKAAQQPPAPEAAAPIEVATDVTRMPPAQSPPQNRSSCPGNS